MSKLNIKLLQRIKAHILEEPKRYEQATYGAKLLPEEGGPACGTVACLAGWAVVLSGKRLLDKDGSCRIDVDTLAYKLTGLGPKGFMADKYYEKFGSVFGTGGGWPKRFATRLEKAKTPKGRARVAADYIDFMIQADKKESTK